jgi:hypothetical protein
MADERTYEAVAALAVIDISPEMIRGNKFWMHLLSE